MHYLRSVMRIILRVIALMALAATPAFAQKPGPDLGPNVLLITPSTPATEAQAKINAIYAIQQHNEFGSERNAILFTPGDYKLDIPIGFYTSVIGLGATPDAVHITGNVHVDAASRNNNATTTFWRAAEGFSVTPADGEKDGTMKWAVSQAVPFRRMHVRGDMVLHQNGWASGGWMSDTRVDGSVGSGPQQQWISRNSDWASWTGSNWNMVFVGVPHPPAGDWPKPAYTKIERTPIIREKPFLEVDSAGRWSVRVPALQANTTGITWTAGSTPGTSIPLTRFYIAHASTDTAATINTQLAHGKHLLLTPGIYDLTEPIHIMRAHTIVLGLGFATLHPTHGTAAITTADVDGLTIAGLLFDAGPQESPMLLEAGPPNSKASHAKDPTALFDIFFRVGGAGEGRTQSNLTINSSDVIVDHTWIWRADHGHNVGWDQNVSRNGLIVNGDRVTVYGLFVEHHQQYQVLWNGNAGRTYFYQSEIPYDPPTQAAYTSAPATAGASQTDGWASYKLAPSVTTHEAWGLGIYSVFRHPDIFVTRAIEVPQLPSIRFHDMITVCLANKGGIRNVINDTGGSTSCGSPRVEPRLTNYPLAVPAQ
jgi:hypothetical protein